MRAYPEGFEAEQWRDVCGEATALLQRLLRIDTTNPPGNEIAAASALREVMAQDGLRCDVLESAPGRANLICRHRSGGAAPPLLLATHLDVVPAGDPDRWTHPPFSGELADGMIWGRGAVDMKNMVAMSAMVMKLLARREVRLTRDIIFAAVADEEQGCSMGSRFLVEQHPELVRAGYALGEVGGYPTDVGKARVFLVQTAEKGVCWLRIRATGEPGHGSVPRPDSALVRLSQALGRLGTTHLPQHNTPVVEAFIEKAAALQPVPDRYVMPLLLNHRLSDVIFDRFFPDKHKAETLRSLLHNTAAPTVCSAGSKTNVIPELAEAELDGRLIPGMGPRDLIDEVRAVVGDGFDIEVIHEARGAVNHPPDSPLWDTICAVLGEQAPGVPVLPTMIPGFTDASQFCRLGARWYGFSPINIAPDSDLNFSDLFHGIDERIPEDGFHWGLGALYRVVEAFCVAAGA